MEIMEIEEKLKKELIVAMKAKDTQRVGSLRLIKSKITEEVKTSNKPDLVGVLDSMIKERLKTIKMVEETRPDMVESEQFEISVISSFLPKRLSKEEISEYVKSAILKVKASSMRDMGKVIGIVKGQLGDTAKPSDIAEVTKSELT